MRHSRVGNVLFYVGDCRSVLASLPDESVHCCVTSPPYWGLRDYGVPPTVWGGDLACKHEWGVRQPLNRKSGLHRMPPNQTGGTKDYSTVANGRGAFCTRCFAWCGAFGLEPTYQLYVEHCVEIFREVHRVLRKDGTLWLNLGDSYCSGGRATWRSGVSENKGQDVLNDMPRPAQPTDLKPKDLIGLPWRVAFALQADGWYLRQDIIWAKPNQMPESVTDRCTKAHEYLFLLSKDKSYYFDAEAIQTPVQRTHNGGKFRGPTNLAVSVKARGTGNGHGGLTSNRDVKRGVRNRRSVWIINTKGYSEAHFATFPPSLIEPCIKAGCPEDGVVLDPFGGAGTTGMVATKFGRCAVLIDLSDKYTNMAIRRVKKYFDARGFLRPKQTEMLFP